MRVRGDLLRRMLGAASLALSLTGLLFCPDLGDARSTSRTLRFYNIHTKEHLTVTYKVNGHYVPSAMRKIDHFMRDWRANKVHKIDPKLIDLIWTIYTSLDAHSPIDLISGYRSVVTNNALRRAGGGQARHSQHSLGKAADIHIPGIPVKTLRNSALITEWGGVGFYPRSGIPFVHVDVGRVRMWPRIPRLELAALFPSGHSGYIPIGGRPITPRDYRLAQASGKYQLAANVFPRSNRFNVARLHPPLPDPRPQLILASDDLDEDGPSEPPVPAPAAIPSPPAPAALAQAEIGRKSGAQASLTFRPYRIAALMDDTPIAEDHTVAPLVHPEQHKLGYMLKNLDGAGAMPLRNTATVMAAVRPLASTERFQGPAVRNFNDVRQAFLAQPPLPFQTAQAQSPSPTKLAAR